MSDMTFCEICDRPIPEVLTSEQICEACWRGHASDPAADKEWAARQEERPRAASACDSVEL